MKEQEKKTDEILEWLYWIGLELAQADEELKELERFFNIKSKAKRKENK